MKILPDLPRIDRVIGIDPIQVICSAKEEKKNDCFILHSREEKSVSSSWIHAVAFHFVFVHLCLTLLFMYKMYA